MDKSSSKAGTSASVHSRDCRYWVCYQVGGWVWLPTHFWDGSWEVTGQVSGWTRLALDHGQGRLELSEGCLSIHCKDWGRWVWPQWSDLQRHRLAWLPSGSLDRQDCCLTATMRVYSCIKGYLSYIVCRGGGLPLGFRWQCVLKNP